MSHTASSETGSYVKTEVDHLGISTYEELQAFRALPRRLGNMNTALAAVATARRKQWQSRKRMRSDALRLFREGQL